MSFKDRFCSKAVQDLAAYGLTYNMATQAVAAKTAGSDPDLKWTGTAAFVLNGQFYTALAALATIDMSSTTVAPDLAGGSIPTTYEQYWLVLATAAGAALVKAASTVTLTSTGATLKIPYFDPTTYFPVAIIKYVNDSGSGFTIGTTNVDGTDCQIYQILGPLVPHDDNVDKN